MRPPGTIQQEWQDGWKVVLGSVVGICFSITHFYTLGVFLAPLAAAQGWSKSEITAAPTILAIINFLGAAAVGRRASKLGVRKIAIPGFIAYCCALACLGFAARDLWTWYALWLVLGMAYIWTCNNIWCISVANRFTRSRGLALAVALCGTGITSAIAPLAATLLIARFGWANAYHLLGLAALIIGLPLIWILLPGNQASTGKGEALRRADMASLPGYSFGQALRTPCFWIMVSSAMILGVGIPTLMVHFVSMATHDGMSAREAATAAGFIGIAAICGRLLTGFLMDVLSGRVVAAIFCAAPAIACLILLNAHGVFLAMAAAALVIGLCAGAEFDILAVLVSRYMGLREFAAINGQIAAVFGIGVGFGPALGSLTYDHYGTYAPLLSGLAFAFLLPAALVLLLGSPAFSQARP